MFVHLQVKCIILESSTEEVRNIEDLNWTFNSDGSEDTTVTLLKIMKHLKNTNTRQVI